MSNQAAIDPIATLEIIKSGLTGEPALTAMNLAIAALRSPRPDWTPCAEGMPLPDAKGYGGKDKAYICSTKSNGVEYIQEFCYGTHIGFDGRDCIGWFFNDSFRGSLWNDLKVIAWMPKPDPYNPDHIRDTTKKIDQDSLRAEMEKTT